ncbi:cupin domain-containing protein [Bradyrhizobium sp. 14AA]
MTSDNVLGRARVSDNEALRKFYEELVPLKAGALWTVANKIEPWFPQSKSVPTIWRYSDIRPAAIKAAELVSTDDAARRVIMLLNPERQDVTATVGWLYSGVQIMLPKEWTTAHSHAAAALRFVMEGKGAYTVVDGERLRVGPRDFLITPSGTWHDHGNDDDTDPVIWQDGLDLPLVNALEANFYAVFDKPRQTGTVVANPSYLTYGVSGLMPVKRDWKHPFSPLSYFPWERTYEALSNYAKVYDGSPWDDIIMEYVNPLNGGSVLPTMGASMQMLRPGVKTKAHRHTGSSIYHVAKGSGYSVINGQRFDWKEKDIFCVPSWAVHEHGNATDKDDACLFSFNDFPVMQKLGLWREESYEENDGHQVVNAQ